uniref:HMG box domain-containing protein n=1 Tax=Panagrellus redivivus TaxID=6233 RepID=A0A7E4W127_PANRE
MSDIDSSFEIVSYPENFLSGDTSMSEIEDNDVFALLKGSRSFVTDEVDVAAFEAYFESESLKVGFELIESEIWEEWLELPVKEREASYEKGKERRILAKAVEICKSEMRDRTDEVGTYCLTCEFKKLCEFEKRPYLERAKDALKSAEKKGESDLKYEVEDPKLVDDMTASLNNRFPLMNTESNGSFYLYCEKTLPLSRYEPEFSGKTKLYQSVILAKRWLKLSAAEKQVYYDAVERIKLIEDDVSSRRISFSDTLDALSFEKTNKLCETTKQDRQQFMNNFPDYLEYFYWNKPSMPKKAAQQQLPVSPRTPTLTKCVPIDYCAITAPKISIVAKHRSKFHVSNADVYAVACFKREYCNHKDGLNDTTIWQRFIGLTRIEQEVYYKKTHRITRTHKRYAGYKTTYGSKLWLNKVETKPWPLLDIFGDAVDNAVAVFIHKMWQTLAKEFRMEDLPCFKATRILERRFWKLSPLEREGYFEMGQRAREMKNELDSEHRKLNPVAAYDAKRNRSRRQETEALKFESNVQKPMKPMWSELGLKKKAFYIEQAMNARKAFVEEFPDVDQYFGFLLNEVIINV